MIHALLSSGFLKTASYFITDSQARAYNLKCSNAKLTVHDRCPWNCLTHAHAHTTQTQTHTHTKLSLTPCSLRSSRCEVNVAPKCEYEWLPQNIRWVPSGEGRLPPTRPVPPSPSCFSGLPSLPWHSCRQEMWGEGPGFLSCPQIFRACKALH